jgi:hypothetical protein
MSARQQRCAAQLERKRKMARTPKDIMASAAFRQEQFARASDGQVHVYSIRTGVTRCGFEADGALRNVTPVVGACATAQHCTGCFGKAGN